MLAPPALRFTYPLAAPRVRETGIAKPGQRLWTFTPNGKAFTSITPASCNAPRSIRWRKARPGAHSGRAAVDVAALLDPWSATGSGNMLEPQHLRRQSRILASCPVSLKIERHVLIAGSFRRGDNAFANLERPLQILRQELDPSHPTMMAKPEPAKSQCANCLLYTSPS